MSNLPPQSPRFGQEGLMTDDRARARSDSFFFFCTVTATTNPPETHPVRDRNARDLCETLVGGAGPLIDAAPCCFTLTMYLRENGFYRRFTLAAVLFLYFCLIFFFIINTVYFL